MPRYPSPITVQSNAPMLHYVRHVWCLLFVLKFTHPYSDRLDLHFLTSHGP